jgi:hypothetical protein
VNRQTAENSNLKNTKKLIFIKRGMAGVLGVGLERLRGGGQQKY